jgi:hypothetical protein
MSPHPALTPELQLLLQQFYYREARLLDNRQYQTWLGLCSPEISYSMPARANPLVDNRQQGHESMISSELELEGVDSNGCPLRDENFAYLALRVERRIRRLAHAASSATWSYWMSRVTSTPCAATSTCTTADPAPGISCTRGSAGTFC